MFTAANESVKSLYNAQVANFQTKAEIYLLSLKEATGKLSTWKNEVAVEVAKSSKAEQTARAYAIAQEAKEIEAQLYSTKISEIKAELEAYEAEMQAFLSNAQVARAKLTLYEADSAEYSASLVKYKTEFEKYSAHTKAVAAQNQKLQSDIRLSVADLDKTNTETDKATVNMQTQAETLKAETINFAATLNKKRFDNTIEMLQVAADSQIAQAELDLWAVKDADIEVKNMHLGYNAKLASSYFEQASNAATRASQGSLKATIVSAKAALALQEAASRSSASLTTGAYSASSISANLSGGGSVKGTDTKSISDTISFSDTLNYSETYSTKIGA